MSDVWPDPLREQALRAPEATAVISAKREVSFAALDAHAERLRAALTHDGVSAGAYVGLMLSPSIDFIAYLFALSRLGAVAVCPNTRNPDTVLVDQLLGLGAERQIRDMDVTGIRDESASAATPISLSAHQPCTVVFTSGSCGSPKAVLHSIGNHLAAAQASNTHNGLGAGDRWLLSLPCYHVAGLGIIYRCLVAGATIVLAPGEDLVDATVRFGVTHLSVVPTQLRRWLDSPSQAAGATKLKSVLVGGAACPQSLLNAARAAGLPVRRTYGMTETTSQITTESARSAACIDTDSSGTALPCTEVRISEAGEIMVRGETLCLGYLAGKGLSLPLTGDGWFQTGDTGILTPGGQLIVTGRLDNMFISGGENVHPEEIECALCTVAGVLRACVVPVADREFGHRPVAFVDTRDGAVAADTLSAALSRILPRYKLPVRYLAWPQDLCGTMKVPRADLLQRV